MTAPRARALVTASAIVLGVACATPAPGALDLDGHRVDPFASTDRPVALLFVSTTCPISNRYAPEYTRLAGAFDGADFYLVYPDPAETADDVRAHLGAYALAIPALRDPAHVLVRRAGATVTPDAAVFAPRGRLVYEGRIDDRHVDLGRERPEASRHELADALDATLAGRPVEALRVPAVGCVIP